MLIGLLYLEILLLLDVVWGERAATQRNLNPRSNAFANPLAIARTYLNVSDRLQAEWTYNQDVLCASAGLHGIVKKEACLLDYHPEALNPSARKFFIRKGLPIYAVTQLYVSHKNKFIYIRQPKSSSSSILRAISYTFCKRPRACTAEEFAHLNGVDRKKWKEYFVFTFVRNPFMRLASAYDMMSLRFLYRRGATDERPTEHCTIPFETFTLNSYSLHMACPDHSCCVYINRRKNWYPDFIQQHVNDQSFPVFTWNGLSTVDYIGRSEFSSEDWSELVKIMSARLGVRLKRIAVDYANSSNGPKEPGHSCMATDVLTRFGEASIRNIAKQYAMDLYRFRYVLLGDNGDKANNSTQVMRK